MTNTTMYVMLYILVRGSGHPDGMVAVLVVFALVPCLGPASYARQWLVTLHPNQFSVLTGDIQ